jgi:hypothetical protein
MVTIINNPPAAQDNSGGFMGMIIGLVVLIVLLYLFFMYGLPALKHLQIGSPQINVPSTIDVNVTQQK